MRSERLFNSWRIALACFILAAATGALLRFGLLYGFPWGLQFANVRHAHSHFMYFGWVTPALMALIVAQLPALPALRLRQLRRVLAAVFILALFAYIAFLLYGYQSALIGDARLPLSVIASGLNMLAWYAFGVIYARATWSLPRTPALRFWDGALFFLFLASLGAWGISLVRPLNISDPFWVTALPQMFLEWFAEGWLVLAVLGLAYAAFPAAAGRPAARWGEGLLWLGLPVIFMLSMPAHVVPPAARLVAMVGGLLFAAGLLANLYALWPAVVGDKSRLWLVSLFFLGLKAISILFISFPALSLWAERMLLRVSYMHWSLAGFVTLAIIAAAGQTWGTNRTPAWPWFTAAVLLMILSLIPLTHLWPAAWSGRWAVQFAAWAALAPVLAASWMLLRGKEG